MGHTQSLAVGAVGVIGGNR